MHKNQVGKWVVFAFQDEGGSNPGEPVTGDAANITGTVYIDGFADVLDDTNPSEVGGGYYMFDLTAVETNGDLLLLVPQSSTANVNVIACPASIYTISDHPAVIKGEVETSGVTAPTTTAFTTTITALEPVAGRTLIFTSGDNEYLAVKITNATLDGSNMRLTVAMEDGGAMPNIPADGDIWEII